MDITSEGGYVLLPSIAVPAKRIVTVLPSKGQISIAVDGIAQPVTIDAAPDGYQAIFDSVVAAAWSAGASLVSAWGFALDPERLISFEHVHVLASTDAGFPWAHLFRFSLSLCGGAVNTVATYEVLMNTADPGKARQRMASKLNEPSVPVIS